MLATLNRILKYGVGDLYFDEKAGFAVASHKGCTYLAGLPGDLNSVTMVFRQIRNPYRFLFASNDWKEFLLKFYQSHAKVKTREAFSSDFLDIVNLEKL